MQAVRQALRPGGLLLFRDYALYDLTQLRFSGSQKVDDCLYRRSDGTLSFFFSREQYCALAEAAGLQLVECDYACVYNTNRKTGERLERAFLHAVHRLPA